MDEPSAPSPPGPSVASARALLERAIRDGAAAVPDILRWRRRPEHELGPAVASYLEQAIVYVEAQQGHLGEALASARRGRELAERSGDADVVIDAAIAAARVLALTGPDDEFRAVVAGAEQFAVGLRAARLHNAVALMEQVRGRLAASDAAMRRALDALPSDADPTFRLALKINLAALKLHEHDYLGARALLVDVIVDATALGVDHAIARATANLGLAEIGLGHVAEGLDRFERAEGELRALGLDDTSAELDRCEIVLRLGLIDEAVRVGLGLLRSSRRQVAARAGALVQVVTALVLAGDHAAARAVVTEPGAAGLQQVNGLLADLAAMLAGDDAALPQTENGTGAASAEGVAALPGLPGLALAADLLSDGATARAGRLLRAFDASAPAGSLPRAVRDAVRAAHDGRSDDLDAAVEACEAAIAEVSWSDLTIARVWVDRVERLAVDAAVAVHDADLAWRRVQSARRMAATVSVLGRSLSNEVAAILQEHRDLLATPVTELGERARALRLGTLEQQALVQLAAMPASPASPVRPTTDGALRRAPVVVYRAAAGRMVALVAEEGRARRLVDVASMAEIEDAVGMAARSGAALLVHRERRSRALAAAWQHALQRLDAMLLAPLGIGRTDAITFLASAELASVTWGVLPSLVGVDVRLSERTQPFVGPRFQPEDRVMLVGGPSLASVGHELDGAAACWREPLRLEDDRATSLATVDGLASASLVHIGAHGRVRGDAPLFSHVTLSDGPLLLGDLQRAPRLPRALVLSACQLGGGGGVRRRATWPVAAALAGRDCSSLVVSTLPVADHSTVPFMACLHAALAAGRTPSEALAAAHADAVDRQDDGCAGFVEIALSGLN